jgi:branched-chain amino acid transport system permease protein
MEFLGKIIISGLMNGSIYGLVAIGFVLIYKSSAVLNFSHGYMLLLGAYIFWFFKGYLGLNLFICFMLTIPSAYIMGILIERFTLRPLIGQPLLSMITVTIFLSLVLEGLVSIVWGTYPLEH